MNTLFFLGFFNWSSEPSEELIINKFNEEQRFSLIILLYIIATNCGKSKLDSQYRDYITELSVQLGKLSNWEGGVKVIYDHYPVPDFIYNSKFALELGGLNTISNKFQQKWMIRKALGLVLLNGIIDELKLRILINIFSSLEISPRMVKAVLKSTTDF